jgi:hypothetical protein
MTKGLRRRLLVGVTCFALFSVICAVGFAGLLGHPVQIVVALVVNRMVDAYFWALERKNHFGLFATTLTIIGGSYGLYNILTRWNTTRRLLFRSYLEAEKKNIDNRKAKVSTHLQVANKRVTRFEASDVNSWIEEAIKEFDSGKLNEAKSTLKRLNEKLEERIEFAAQQERVAKKQQAAIHLFLGSIEAAQFKSDAALAEFQEVRNLTNDEDTDALKYIAQQKIARSEREPENGVGGVLAQDALAAAIRMREVGGKLNDRRIQAEALLLQARANLRLKNGRQAARDRANEGIAEMERVAREAATTSEENRSRDDSLNGQLQELLGDAQVLLNAWLLADSAYSAAIARFTTDAERSEILARKKNAAALRRSDEALRPWPHPNESKLERSH